MPDKLTVPAAEFCALDLHCYLYAAYHWQTLIGGVVAVGAAWYAGRFVRHQILSSDRIEKDRLARREKAARAVLPLTLTRFVDFAEDCAKTIKLIGDGTLTPSTPPLPLLPPDISETVISDIEHMIEAANDDQVAEILTRLAGHTQVLHSIVTSMVLRTNERGNGLYRRDPNRPAFELRTARVHAAASGLFAWARSEAEGAEKISWDAIESSLAILGLDDACTQTLVNRGRQNGSAPLDW